jgi:hypothetical protein
MPGSCRTEAGGFCNVAVETKLKGQPAGTVCLSFWRKADSLHVTVEKINGFSSSDLDKADPYVLIQYWTEKKKTTVLNNVSKCAACCFGFRSTQKA